MPRKKKLLNARSPGDDRWSEGFYLRASQQNLQGKALMKLHVNMSLGIRRKREKVEAEFKEGNDVQRVREADSNKFICPKR